MPVPTRASELRPLFGGEQRGGEGEKEQRAHGVIGAGNGGFAIKLMRELAVSNCRQVAFVRGERGWLDCGMRSKWGWIALAAGLLQVSGCKNLHRIEGNWWRSAQPKPEWLRGFIEKEKIDVILCLRGDRRGAADHDAVIAVAKEYRVPVAPIELSAHRPLTREQVLALLDFLRDHGEESVLVHCHGGADRSGLMAFLYLVEVRGWEKGRAKRRALGWTRGHIRCPLNPWSAPEMDRFADAWRDAAWARRHFGVALESAGGE